VKMPKSPREPLHIIVSLFFLSLWLMFLPEVSAEPKLPHIFSDHMVLQRDMRIAMWGWADPGERVSVTLASHARTVVAGVDGTWRVSLPAMQAGGPFTVVVRGKKSILFKDVMIGEVWIASGQSNMTYALSGATGAAEEIPKANYPDVRLFTVPKKIALTPEEDTLPASWQTCSPDTAKSFSAVGYFFARDLHKALGVPVGIILSAWPGTLGEEWTDVKSLAAQPILRPIVERWNSAPASVKDFAAKQADISLEFDDFELLPSAGDAQSVAISDFDDGSARTQTGGVWTYSWQDAPETTFELAAPGRGGAGYAARVAGKLDGASSSLLQANFKADGSPADLNAFAGIQFSVRGRGSFQFQTLQPTISDWDNYSVETMEATSEWKQVKIWFKDLKQAGWGVSAPFTRGALTGFVINVMAPVGDPDRPPAGLYDGMISPLLPFRIRGAIWYQGEGNTWRAYQYRTLLPALIRGWRKSWDEGELPFLIVQLPNQGTSPELGDSIWAELREAQLLTAKSMRNTGLAVTIDVGDPNNLHPPRKTEIGQRLVLWALGTTYGKKIVYSGPLYDAMEIKGGEAHVRFSQVGDGLDSHGEAFKGFAIAGEDRKFHWANARIEGDEVIVSSPEVSAPVAVRYGWANSPECSLYNKNGLPASPFRTDDWPGASFEKR
jgi:sialate O-acetylesterase